MSSTIIPAKSSVPPGSIGNRVISTKDALEKAIQRLESQKQAIQREKTVLIETMEKQIQKLDLRIADIDKEIFGQTAALSTLRSILLPDNDADNSASIVSGTMMGSTIQSISSTNMSDPQKKIVANNTNNNNNNANGGTTLPAVPKLIAPITGVVTTAITTPADAAALLMVPSSKAIPSGTCKPNSSATQTSKIKTHFVSHTDEEEYFCRGGLNMYDGIDSDEDYSEAEECDEEDDEEDEFLEIEEENADEQYSDEETLSSSSSVGDDDDAGDCDDGAMALATIGASIMVSPAQPQNKVLVSDIKSASQLPTNASSGVVSLTTQQSGINSASNSGPSTHGSSSQNSSEEDVHETSSDDDGATKQSSEKKKSYRRRGRGHRRR